MTFFQQIVTSILKYLPLQLNAFQSKLKHTNSARLLLMSAGLAVGLWWLRRISRRRKSVKNQVVVITGAGSGLGRNFAQRFVALGAKVACIDINEGGMQETIRIVKDACGQGVTIRAYKADVSKESEVNNAIANVTKDMGPVDILINNAGIVVGKLAEDLTERDMRKTLDVNLLGPMLCTSAVLKSMQARNQGHLVYICSAAGLHGVLRLADYCASKGGLILYAESVAEELRLQRINGVKTTIINPYFVDTGMFSGVSSPILPLLNPGWVADKSVDAVLLEQDWMCMGFMVMLTPFLKATLPMFAQHWLGDTLSVTSSMNAFEPRPVRG